LEKNLGEKLKKPCPLLVVHFPEEESTGGKVGKIVLLSKEGSREREVGRPKNCGCLPKGLLVQSFYAQAENFSINYRPQIS